MSTIAAIATPRGEGGIAIVRVSGDKALSILRAAFIPAGRKTRAFASHRLMYGRCIDGEGRTIDEVMTVYMRAPHTYTREDVIEIHCHGGAYAARAVLRRVLSLGADVAAPGEFTRRAFENGRVSLDEAEAVMGVIAAGSEAALRASVRALEGGASAMIKRSREKLTGLLSLIEAADDFPDEIDEDVTGQKVADGAREAASELLLHVDERRMKAVREGVTVALCGRPNVGKSSLMNALLGYDRAIVTDTPGTTRDTLAEPMTLQGVRVDLIDTAGQRDTLDDIERIGVQRAEKAQREADIVLIVLDASEPLTQDDERLLSARDERSLVILNKCDIASTAPSGAPEGLRVSARTGEGMDALIEALSGRVGDGALDETLLISERHQKLAGDAARHLESAADALDAGTPLDVASVDIWEARRLLGEITGEDATEAVIDAVFSRFCVGK